MELNELLKIRGKTPEINVDAENQFKEYMEKNGFTFFDFELAKKHKLDYYFSEKAFFEDIVNTARRYIDDVPGIIFAPKQYSEFAVSADYIDGKNIIAADDLVECFLTEFSSLAFFMSSDTSKQYDDMRPFKRALIAIIDMFACRRIYTGFDEMF